MADSMLFRALGPERFEPTDAAVGPWDAGIVHGAAVAALLAGRLEPDEGTLGRVTIEMVAPVPMAPLVLERQAAGGGRRVQREEAALTCDGKVVAAAQAVVVRRQPVALPEKARHQVSPFDPEAAPALDEPNRAAAETVGHESFDSVSAVVEPMRVEGDRRVHLWIALAAAVVDDDPVRGVEVAAVAADYAQSAVNRRLSFAEWSYRNAEQTLHLARPPEGTWIGMRSNCVLSDVGAGFNASDLFDAGGRLGHSAATLVVEERRST